MTKTISKESISRLLKDVKQIMQHPLTDNGIYYSHDDEDILKGYAMIVGPEDTPYFGGFYFFRIHFPCDYPHTPPIVTYCTNGDNIRFNPNLYKCGKVCVSLLNTWRGEQWTSCQTISTILLTLCTLLCKDPLLNEPGITLKHPDFDKYTKIIEYKNIEIAVLQMYQKKEGVFMNEFEIFSPFLKEEFLKNKEKILASLQEKAVEFPNIDSIVTMLYSMNVVLNFPKLLDNFQKAIMVQPIINENE
jgi:ubiquitin-conjugating enzyme E2 Z